MLKPLIFTLLCVLSLAVSAGEREEYIAAAEGQLTIGTDGLVKEVRITDGDKLGSPVVAALEQQVRAWKFKPVLEAGSPIAVVGLMRLELFMQRTSGEDAVAFGIRNVWFVDPPGSEGEGSDENLLRRMRPPSYPSGALRGGLGAQVMLLLRLDAEGGVEEVTTEDVAFLGGKPSSKAGRHAAVFQRAAETAAQEWRMPGHDPGMVLRVPVTFKPASTGIWYQRFPAPTPELPAWALAALATKGMTADLAASGQKLSARLQLLTPLQPAGG